MTLEEKLRAYAAKGELVHLSLVSSLRGFEASFAAASPAGGYAAGTDSDPVEAIEKAFKASPVKPPRVRAIEEPFGETKALAERGFNNEWTAP